MRKIRLAWFLALAMPAAITLSASLAGCAPAPPPAVTLPDAKGWKLVFRDEFEGSRLDTNRWNTCYPWVEADGGCTNPGNHELEWYQPDEVFIENGLLRLRAQDRSVKAGFPYTSGMVTSHTKFNFQYGYVEARLKVPSGQGLWPALWMLPEAELWPPEIDILEVLGHQPSTVYTTLHYTLTGSDHLSQGDSCTGPDFSTDFHTYGMLWEPFLLIWYVDGVECFAVEGDGRNVPQEPFYLLANLAVGGDWPGAPNENTAFPAYYGIDYIRVFANTIYIKTAAAPTQTPTGGKRVLHTGQIVAYSEEGTQSVSFSPGVVNWKAQVVDQDGRPASRATVQMVIESQDGSFRQTVYSKGSSDHLGWANFSALVSQPGVYHLRVEKISGGGEYDESADAASLEITVK